MGFTTLGDGTVTLTVAGGATPMDFSCEVIGAKVTHEYEDVGQARKMLCGDNRPASKTRQDGFTAEVENNLEAGGLYAFIFNNDMSEAQLEFVPNTAAGAKWAGAVVLTLPGEIGADEYGAPIASSVEWTCTQNFTFTPATAAAVVADTKTVTK